MSSQDQNPESGVAKPLTQAQESPHSGSGEPSVPRADRQGQVQGGTPAELISSKMWLTCLWNHRQLLRDKLLRCHMHPVAVTM